MNPAIAAVLGAGIAGLVSLCVAAIGAAVGRGGRRADIAEKISEASDRIFERMEKDISKVERQCEKCTLELRTVKAVLRATVRAIDANDPAAIDVAVAAARELF